MKVAVFGTTVSESFLPVLNEFFDFLKKHSIEIHIYKPFYSFLVNDLKTEPLLYFFLSFISRF